MWTLNSCLLTGSGVGIWYPIQEIQPGDTAIFRDIILSHLSLTLTLKASVSM